MKQHAENRAAGLSFLVAFATLFIQVLIHRIVSAKLLNNYAFLVISLTMLGFAFSGVFLTRWLTRFLNNFNDAFALSAAFFVLTTLGAVSLIYHLDFGPQFISLHNFVRDFNKWLFLVLILTVPFGFCGLMLGALLSAPTLPARRIYFFDLVGSGLGAFSVVPAISYLGVEKSLLLICGTVLVGTFLLTSSRSRFSSFVMAMTAIALGLSVKMQDQLFDMRYPGGSMLAQAKEPGSPVVLEHVAWDPIARIEVSRIPQPSLDQMNYPCLIGENQSFHARFKRMLTQNNYAFTYAVDYDGNLKSLQGIEETIYSAAYQASSVIRPRTLIIGVGGGFDILTALFFDAAHITAVEINAATVGILTKTYRDYFHHWVLNPKVHLVHAEGRHYLATTSGQYDILQLSGVDSYSGTAAAAHVFSENYLYTAEAFDLYLSRLTEKGILNMMRLEYIPPREMLRALTTAVAALRRAGIQHPARHIAMLTATNQNFTALLVKKTPFTDAEEQKLALWTSKSRFFALSAGPQINKQNGNMYQKFLSMGTPAREAAFIKIYPFDISPAEDNRPFFFRYSFWWHLFPSARGPVLATGFPFMEYSLLLLTAVTGIVALFCIYLPLRFFAADGIKAPGIWRYGFFFAGTGLGYLAIEIAFLQKFGLFLGHPNYALSVVLAALLLATGIGSLFSQTIVTKLGGIRFVTYVMAFILLAEYAFIFPWLLRLIALAFVAKVALVSILVMPVGICLGTFLPSAIERLKPTAPAFVPWAWGINGIFSVLAPLLSIGFSMTFGMNALLLASIPVYLIVGFVLPPSSESLR